MKLKKAFVLAGGGAAGAYQAGCLKAVDELGIVPDFIWGTSAGALNACGYSYVGPSELIKMWRSINSRSDVFGANFFRWFGLPFGVDALYNSKPLRKKIERIILENSPRFPVYVNVTDLIQGRLVQPCSLMENQKHFVDWAVASASIPAYCDPVKGRYVDGGLIENIPLKSVIAQGAEEIYMFLNYPHEKSKRITKDKISGIKGITIRSLELVMKEGYWEDFRICKQMNGDPSKKNIKIHMLAPEVEILDMLDFSQGSITKGIETGYRDTLKTLTKAEAILLGY